MPINQRPIKKFTIKRNSMNTFILSNIVSLTFIGYYTLLLIYSNIISTESSRNITVPTRIVILSCCFLLYVINIRKKSSNHRIFFLIFSTIYIIRIALDFVGGKYLYISYYELTFYFLTFCFLPYLTVSKTDLTKINYESIFKTFLLYSLLFCFMTVYFYNEYIGNTARLSGIEDSSILSPLILSYCGSLVMGVLFFYIKYNQVSKFIKIISLITICLSIIPFLLGASRGSIIAIFLPFIILISTQLNSLKMAYNIVAVVLVGYILFMTDTYLESGLFDRFLSIGEAVDSESSSAIRLKIWESSFNQFMKNPLIGDKIHNDFFNQYPHNIILETLQSVGILGFIPFFTLLISGVYASFYIMKYHSSYAWIAVIYLQAFSQSLFSGALYSSAWFWLSLCLILSLMYSLKNQIVSQKILEV